MRSFYARVEHKAVVGMDVVNLLAVTSLIYWKYALEAIINWLLLYFLVHDNRLLSML